MCTARTVSEHQSFNFRNAGCHGKPRASSAAISRFKLARRLTHGTIQGAAIPASELEANFCGDLDEVVGLMPKPQRASSRTRVLGREVGIQGLSLRTLTITGCGGCYAVAQASTPRRSISGPV